MTDFDSAPDEMGVSPSGKPYEVHNLRDARGKVQLAPGLCSVGVADSDGKKVIVVQFHNCRELSGNYAGESPLFIIGMTDAVDFANMVVLAIDNAARGGA